jgi:hypothetical protein
MACVRPVVIFYASVLYAQRNGKVVLMLNSAICRETNMGQ